MKARILSFINPRWPLIILLIGYVLLSFITFSHYGITWDEKNVYGRGDDLVSHYIGNSDINIAVEGRYDGYLVYNASYGAINTIMTRIMFNTDNFVYRHISNMLINTITIVAFFEILLLMTKNKYISLLGCVLLLLTPIFSGHIPANPKDVPYAMFMLFSLYVILVSSKISNTIIKTILLGVIFGLTGSQRVLGLQLIFIYFAFRIFTSLKEKGKINFADIFNVIVETLNISIVTYVVLSLSWPFFAANPVVNGLEILRASKSYPWEGTVLLARNKVQASMLPWYYLPLHLLAQLPLFVITPFIGAIIYIKKFVQNPVFVLSTMTIIINILIYLILRPVLYDTIRHYIFIVPVILIISVGIIDEAVAYLREKGIKAILKPSYFINIGIVAISLVSVLLTSYQIVKLYPYQYAYFNEIVGYLPGAEGKYETEYWLAGYKEATEWIIKNEAKGNSEINILVKGTSYPAEAFFTDKMKITENIDEANYVISTTRKDKHIGMDQSKLVYSVERQGVVFVNVYKLK